MLTNLKTVLGYGRQYHCAIAAFNVFGYEDAFAVVRAAEAQDKPVILMANKDAVAHMPVKILGGILRGVAESAKILVCVHLDHSPSVEKIKEGIDAGFTSVMLDASQRPFEENAEQTIKVVEMAHPMGISVESEIGSVGYSDPHMEAKTFYTEPEEARLFAEQTKVDALAVSVGNLHRMTTQTVHLQFDRLNSIKEMVSVPLVMHGSSGIPDMELKQAISDGICKVNIGTALRMVFGNTLRQEMGKNPEEFDRIKLFQKCMVQVQKKAEEKIILMSTADNR